MIVVCNEFREDMKADLVSASVWMAVQNMLLAATAEGLGSCVYTLYDEAEEGLLKEILKIPKTYGIACMIQLGYSAVEPPSPSRRDLEEMVSYERF